MYCTKVTSLRERTFRANSVLKYLSPITQLHGWWHLLAGYAIYLQILACIQQRLLFLNIEHSLEKEWTGVTIKVDVIQGAKLSKSEQYQD